MDRIAPGFWGVLLYRCVGERKEDHYCLLPDCRGLGQLAVALSKIINPTEIRGRLQFQHGCKDVLLHCGTCKLERGHGHRSERRESLLNRAV